MHIRHAGMEWQNIQRFQTAVVVISKISCFRLHDVQVCLFSREKYCDFCTVILVLTVAEYGVSYFSSSHKIKKKKGIVLSLTEMPGQNRCIFREMSLGIFSRPRKRYLNLYFLHISVLLRAELSSRGQILILVKCKRRVYSSIGKILTTACDTFRVKITG